MFQKTKKSILWIPQNKKPRSKASLLRDKQKYIGTHLIVEFWNGKNIENPKELERILIRAAKRAKNIPLEVAIHKFSPQGITGVVLLAESHIALHSWPEINYLAIDIFTCGKKAFPHKALDYLKREFKPRKVEIKEIKRGKIYAPRERFKKNI
ncbi:MAG: adenosylmethionine decarboxylase [Patescibacteria group bacterium]|nr:adenosylmethionine decarboxylase [Patescibacteria group bacterium]